MKKIVLLGLILVISPSIKSQTCQNNIPSDTPNSRYTINTDGTVLDKQTGLIWMRCSLGQTLSNNTCSGSTKNYNWQTALQIADTTVFAGQTDWRLPNIKELRSIVDYHCINPSINLTIFPNTLSGTQTDGFFSSSYIDNMYVWGLSFAGGYNNYYGQYADKTHDGFVRLVRGGQ